MIILCDMIDRDEDKSKFARIYLYINIQCIPLHMIYRSCVEDAEDIVEESFIKVIGILKKIDEADIERPRCKNLMITITKNTAIDFIRKTEKEIQYIEAVQASKSVEELYIEQRIIKS